MKSDHHRDSVDEPIPERAKPGSIWVGKWLFSVGEEVYVYLKKGNDEYGTVTSVDSVSEIVFVGDKAIIASNIKNVTYYD